MLTPYPGSTLANRQEQQFDRYPIILGIDKKGESQPALEEIATFLKSQEGTFFVVGHTDMTGSFDHNMSLSRARAAAVVDALGKGHGIASGRLEAHGVGPLAPAATNEDDPGRARNRRVVLVKR